jgi:hypothetical protein
MALLLRADGTREEVTPKGSHWTLEELQGFVGGYIQQVMTTDGRFLIVNEDGKYLPMLRVNRLATALYVYGYASPIVGDAVVVDTLAEMNGPEEDDE